MTTPDAARARELLEIAKKAPGSRWRRYGTTVIFFEGKEEFGGIDVRHCPLQEELASAIASLPDLAACLRASLEREAALQAEVERLRGIAEIISSIFAHGDFKAETYNESELEKALRAGGFYTGNAFTGRITGRNRPDIPSDAGVPSRAVKDCLTTEWPDEARIDAIGASGPTGDHYPDAVLPNAQAHRTGEARSGAAPS